MLGFFLLIATAPGCSSPRPTPRPISLDSLTARLDVLVPALLRERGVPGAAIALINDGMRVWSHGYGLADLKSSSPVTSGTRFNVGSISKSITAWGVMTLVEAGRISLDAPVDRYLKRWHLPEGGFDNTRVTPQTLLTHTSGLSIYPVSASINEYRADERLPSLTEAMNRDYPGFGRLRVVEEPGTHYRYNNGDYVVLQLLVEDVTGQPFAGYMQKYVFGPLGMKSTGYGFSTGVGSSTARPYRPDGEPWPRLQGVELASGGVYTTVDDLALFVAAADSGSGLPPGRGVLKPETVSSMITPAKGTGGQYGFGYQMVPLKKQGYFVSHQGANDGFRGVFFFDPPTRSGVVILTNSDAGGRIVGEIVCLWAAWAGIELAEPCPDNVRQ
jgi:CubicO group peptidase (beta-lactamase class C family)